MKLVQAWLEIHRDEIMADWSLGVLGIPIERVKPLELNMNKIVSVVALVNGYLKVMFSDGRVGEFDVKPFMRSEFFSALRDLDYFAQVGLFFLGVGWLGGQDLSPDMISAQLLVRVHP